MQLNNYQLIVSQALRYCLYLRKSRADLEAEARGEGETLARHEKALLDLAKKLKINIVKIYREIVSGETIAARPVMQELLAEVEQGMWDGVLVMEVERLARGDTVDQGIVAQTFKFSNTKIITPMKIYDPNNEYDEEYFEFGLFMSRREYKTTNRRLQRGRADSVKEGKYVGSVAPFGYKRIKIKNDKGYTLEPIPEQADVVKMIFDWYTSGEVQEDGSRKRLGMTLIARRLNELGIKPQKKDVWTLPTIRDMLSNPVYMGKIRWNFRPHEKKMVNGKIAKRRPHSNDFTIVNGLHEAIIDEFTFNLAQHNIKKNPPKPIGENYVIKNPLAGLIICGKCGRAMVRKLSMNGSATLACTVPQCGNVSSKLEYVEDSVLDALEGWVKEYRTSLKPSEIKDSKLKLNVLEKNIRDNQNKLQELQNQLNTVFEMLEKGVYTTEQFLQRSQAVSSQIEDAKSLSESLSKELKREQSAAENRSYIIPRVEHLLKVYNSLPDAQSKNALLKEVVKKVVYTKERDGKCKDVDPKDFTIALYPVLPYHGSNS
ncbi:recombinase family protein [Anaerocolumna aminovalerica]|uniref:recombinase family protein n=1 Tax=Anaerocolumna aminovalerica TaxID=1527 RepID=UPI001C0EF838|nr:recombinase family protein [Anaerocolumna aminovalerica]MBU5331451.1 recombinase family protein [Anaerocolumna aminovalerica]